MQKPSPAQLLIRTTFHFLKFRSFDVLDFHTFVGNLFNPPSQPIWRVGTGCPKKMTWFWSLITASDFQIQTFTSNYSQKEVLNFWFDVLLRQFRETHRVKCWDKNINIFLIVRRKMAYHDVPKKKYMFLNCYNFF